MSKKPKGFTATMILRHGCAWKGCEAKTLDRTLPRDWRWLAVWWGPAALPPWANGNIEDRDATLCPAHARELDGLLKDIGNRLKETKGNA